MSARFYLIFGLIAGATFVAASTILGALLPDYDPVTQTISEIGRVGSPYETVFKIINLFVAACFVLFALGIYRYSKERRLSVIPAAMLGYYGVMQLGVFIFEAPHPWHNLFGIASVLGYFAPFALAVSWPRASGLTSVRRVSIATALFLIVSLVLNLSELFVRVTYIVEHIGIVQRTLLVFHIWCVYLALALLRSAGQAISRCAPSTL